MDLTLELIVGSALAVVGIGLGEWRARQARQGEHRLRDELTAARRDLRELPREVAEIVTAADRQALAAGEQRGTEADESLLADVGYADVTNDGNPDLLVMHGVGAHGRVLKVYGVRDVYRGFERLGELFSGAGATFDVGDFDGDRQTEIATAQADFDREPGRSYADAVLVETFYRWDGTQFAEVGHGAVHDPRAGELPPHLRRLVSRPSWALTPSNS